MIISFKDPLAKQVFESVKTLVAPGSAVKLRRRLDILHQAKIFEDLSAIEIKKTRRADIWRSTVDDRWSIQFHWTEFGPDDVELLDATRREVKFLLMPSPTAAERLPPLHPGEILREEFMKPLKLTSKDLSFAAGVSAKRIERIRQERTSITEDTALRFGRVLGTSSEFWMGLQARYDLQIAEDALGDALERLQPIPRYTAS